MNNFVSRLFILDADGSSAVADAYFESYTLNSLDCWNEPMTRGFTVTCKQTSNVSLYGIKSDQKPVISVWLLGKGAMYIGTTSRGIAGIHPKMFENFSAEVEMSFPLNVYCTKEQLQDKNEILAMLSLAASSNK
jgi:hypothetical protein